MPNFAKLIRNGVASELRSIYPIVSPTIWTTIYTGKKPEKHGVKDFYINPETIKTKQIWEILMENGEEVGVFNPMTAFEPGTSYRFFVPGFLTSIISAHPSDLKFLREFSAKIRNRELSFLSLIRYAYKFSRYGCKVNVLFNGLLSYLKFLNRLNSSKLEILHRIKLVELMLYSDVFIYLLKKHSPTFSVFYDEGIDLASHYYWKYIEPESFSHVNKRDVIKYRNVIRNFYKVADRILGRILSLVDDKTNLIVVSDHGFETNLKRRIDCEINVNSLSSYLDLKDNVYGIKVFHGGIFRPKDRRISLEKVEDIFRKVKCRTIKGEIMDLFDVVRVDNHIKITVNDTMATDENQRLIMPNGTECLLKDIINFSPEISGKHYIKGVIIMTGPDIESGGNVEDASIFDVTPTILALERMSIPKDVDGRVLIETFKEKNRLEYVSSYDSQATLTKRNGKEQLTTNEETYIKQKLKELGYL